MRIFLPDSAKDILYDVYAQSEGSPELAVPRQYLALMSLKKQQTVNRTVDHLIALGLLAPSPEAGRETQDVIVTDLTVDYLP